MDSVLLKDRDFLRWTLKLSFPIMIQQLLLISVNAFDSFMMGRFGEIEMSAVSQSSQIFFIFSVMTYGIAGTCSILVAQYLGKKDSESIKTIVAISLRLGLVLGLVVGLCVNIFSGSVLRIFSNNKEVIAFGRQYLSIASYSYILYGVTNVLYGVFKGTEKVKYVFWGNAVCYTLNIALNYVFIFGKFGVPALGVRGAALGTLIARCVEFIFVICMFSKKIDFKLRDIFRKNTLLLLDFLRVMRPIMGHELIWGIGTSMSQVVMGQISPMATTAYNITYMLYQLFASIFSGLGGAAQTIIGKTIGSGDTERVKKSARTLLIYATILGVLSMCSVLLLKTPFISLYNVSAETAQYAEKIMPIMAVALFFMAWEVVGLVNILRGGGDGKTGFFTDVVVMWMIAIPLGLLAAFRWNLSPVLIILFIKIDMPLKATVGLVRVLKMKWIKNLTRENTIL